MMDRDRTDLPPSALQSAALAKPTANRWKNAGWLVGLLLAANVAQGQLPPPPVPPGNPLTPGKIKLGKVLFWDEQLASTGTVACGTCHIPRTGGSDPRSLSSPLAIHPSTDEIFGNADDVFGSPGVPLNDEAGVYQFSDPFGLTVQVTHRRTTSAINAAYAPTLFWDGRAGGQFVDPLTSQVILPTGGALESQAMGPPVSDVEMGHQTRDWNDVLARLEAVEPLALAHDVPAGLLVWINGRTYPQLFEEVFGPGPITAAKVGLAIASYERTQFTNQAPFDAFLAGDDGALTEQEVTGRGVFTSKSCDRCHSLAIMTDHAFHYIGVRPAAEDQGRFSVTNVEADRGRMRTPSLRNVEMRAPYMHTGRFATLEDVVDFYDRGGDFDAPNKDPLVRPLNLTPTEREALLAFLKRPLTDPRLAAGQAPFDRPSLFTESSRAPRVEGTGLPGTGGLVPQVVAIEPALRGSSSFTVGVQGALGGASALLVVGFADPGLTRPVAGDFAFESMVLNGSGAGGGYGSLDLNIPDDVALENQELFGRWYVSDTGGGGSDAISPLFRFRVFRSLENSVVYADDFETGNSSRWSADFP